MKAVITKREPLRNGTRLTVELVPETDRNPVVSEAVSGFRTQTIVTDRFGAVLVTLDYESHYDAFAELGYELEQDYEISS